MPLGRFPIVTAADSSEAPPTMVRTAEQIARSKALEIRVHPNGRWLVSGGKVRVSMLSS